MRRLVQMVFVLVIFGVVGGWLRGLPEASGASGPMFDQRLKMPREVASLMQRSCADCHSEATRWPWYAKVPPASWLVQRDVAQARKAMNLSKWSSLTRGMAMGTLTAACSDVELKRMPDEKYVLLHPGARMNTEEVQQFCAWTRSASADLKKTAAPAAAQSR
jgi:hypothetical protein